MKHPAFTGVCMVLCAAVLWGSTGTAQSLAPAGLSAYWVGALRLVIATVFFAAFVWWGPACAGWANRLAGLPWHWVLLAGACMAAYNLSFFAGVKSLGVAVGTAIAIGSGPVWAGLLQMLASRRPPAPAWWCGTLLAVAGGAAMVLQGGGGAPVTPAGLVLCLAAGLCYAAYALINKRLVDRHAPAVVTWAVFACAAGLAMPVAAAQSGAFSTTGAGWAVLVYLGVVTTGVAYLLFSHALRHLTGATGVTLALGEPVTAFVLAIAVVHERPGAAAFAGMLAVLAGLALVVRAEVKATARVQGGVVPTG